MFTQSEFQRIENDYQDEVKLAREKLQRIWMSLFILGFIISGAAIGISYSLGFILKLPVVLIIVGIMILIPLIGFLISLAYVSEKPTYEYLFKTIYDRMANEKYTSLKYSAYPKAKWTFNKDGGLFPNYTTTSAKRLVETQTSKGTRFQLYQCQITSSNGKTQQVHFDGTYWILPFKSRDMIQIRTNGRPSMKGVKFKKVDHDDHYKIFMEKDKDYLQFQKLYESIFQQFETAFNPKKLYMSITNDAIHVGLEYHQKTNRIHPLTLEALNRYHERFINELGILDHVENLLDGIY